MIVHDCEQRSPEWHMLRAGKLCGSKAHEMMATIKSGESAGWRNLRAQLVLERLTGRPQERHVTTQAMQDGIEREAAAGSAYEALTGNLLTATGFCQHDTLPAGCSLDGHVGDYEGIIEIKCPLPATHLDYLTSGLVPGDYYKQILHNLWITGAQWCDWLSYHPDFPEGLQMKLVRVQPTKIALDDYQDKAVAFLHEVEAQLQAVRTTLNLPAQLRESVEALA